MGAIFAGVPGSFLAAREELRDDSPAPNFLGKIMKRLLVAVCFGLLALGCRNDCDEALDHWEECMGREEQIPGMDPDNCSGRNECVGECVKDAECIDLRKFADPRSTYAVCVSKCPAS
jgi:hypothetical protein